MTGIDLGDAFVRHRRDLALTAMRILRNRDELDDVLQDVFVEAIRGVRNLRHPAALRAWLTKVTMRAAMRRRRRHPILGFDDVPGVEQVVDHAASSPPDRALLAAIDTIIRSIPPDRRRAWALRYVNGEPLNDIAVSCRCSLATAKRRIAEVQSLIDAAMADDFDSSDSANAAA